ncbi:hypothetical protein GPECTOR_1g434 [Gonium pectorale]|uniref:Uncharacterized protein n=1 Tax=Gonium pectorale TaxID=33097 RepID=A0A150H371_GONPE|nr:hypothetical protein GPECTOR_1g434 [Gonium pectorale]|eukprot:KXZ56485.1 hypothetical protein GPECTOR_1g434 [Gonium pectorale]
MSDCSYYGCTEIVVMYTGKLSNVHHFTIEYPDKTSELASLKELRPRLIVPGTQERARGGSVSHAAGAFRGH